MSTTNITSPNSRKRRLESESAPVHIAFQGMTFSYTFLAAKSFFTDYTYNLDYRSKQSLKEVMESVKSGECQYGLVPLESSSYGTIHGVYDRLLASDGQLVIIGEIGQIEHHALCVRDVQSTVTEVDIDTVVSHPHILECCSDYLDRVDAKRIAHSKPVIKRIASWDTAAACAEVAESTEGVVAAICSKEAAAHYHMRILEQAAGSDLNAEVRILYRCLLLLTF